MYRTQESERQGTALHAISGGTRARGFQRGMRRQAPSWSRVRPRAAIPLLALLCLTQLPLRAAQNDLISPLLSHAFPLAQGIPTRQRTGRLPAAYHGHFQRAASFLCRNPGPSPPIPPLRAPQGFSSPHEYPPGTDTSPSRRRWLQATVPADAKTLIQAKAAWGASFAQANTWTAAKPCSQWFGVQCIAGDSTFTVLGLSLPDQGLKGRLQPVLGNLASLTLLNLTTTEPGSATANAFSGGIPGAFSKLTNLRILLMLNSGLSGAIPPGLGAVKSLGLLGLGGNQLSGSIPPALGQLTGLVGLDLSYNALTGNLPPALGNLKNASFLITAFNQIQGPVPASFSSLVSITYLVLASNRHTGTIAASLASLPKLRVLGLGKNNLRGSISGSFGSALGLVALVLGGNSLQGPIPPSIGNLKDLQVLDLSGNRLSRPVPRSFSQLSSLMLLSLGSNKFTGRIPNFLRAPNLVSFGISSNRLTGTIPRQLSTLSGLTQLNLQRNYLTGPIPNIWPGLKSLALADLSYNQLTGRPATPDPSTGVNMKYSGNYLIGGPFLCARLKNTGNCFTGCLDQRTTAQCARFCRTTSPSGTCNGHGYCFLAGRSRTPTCRCFGGYGAPVRRPGTCKKRKR